MTLIIYIALLTMVVGLAAVTAHPSPYFGSLSLVVVSGASCIVLMGYGANFLSLIMFLVYLGGMLVVFAYTTALAADSFPLILTYSKTHRYLLLYTAFSLVFINNFMNMKLGVGWDLFYEFECFGLSEPDARGVALIYLDYGALLVMGGCMLLLTLLAVLELTRGNSRGSLRAV
uniref:NADH-ubiquinone oxidoreductase chain 6 n=1 Tax=Cynoglossus itinus TaxID=626211 RepID=W5QKG6_9PLEU|nr:NADH dehydrogenase subunit 6 [Cynoglossus itinus]AFC88402.1 NADH dehydrogenase subunit 6 [Cynoglossus itinus]